MQLNSFIDFLVKRNRTFIENISCESAIHLMDTYCKTASDKKRKCVVISFDPPLAYPPFAFNFRESDSWYFKGAESNDQFFDQIEEALENTEHPYVVIVERSNPPHRRKIQRWIKNFRDVNFRNKPMSSFPKFILAEYRAPLFNMKFSEINLGDA